MNRLAIVILLFSLCSAFWRLPCYTSLGVYRIDPIVSPNLPSQHSHTLHGADGINFSATYDDLRSSSCTSCAVTQDLSVYWTPPLMFAYPNDTIVSVPQKNGMLIYYFLFGENITAFPEGFQMVVGNSSRRKSTLPPQDPPQSLWSTHDKAQGTLAQRALGFTCLNYKGVNEGALSRHALPEKEFITSHCPDGLRLELMFPSCWDGVHLDLADHHSHLAYPDLLMQGSCPPGFYTRLPSLYYETIWNTAIFEGIEGRFLLSNGDQTGLGYHGDFLNGWDTHVLQEAINLCTNLSGHVEDCPPFKLQTLEAAAKCHIHAPATLQNDDCEGPRCGLCGNVSIS